MWLLPSEGPLAWLRTLTGLRGLPFNFEHSRAINHPIRCCGSGWVSGWEGCAEGCSNHRALPSRESGSKACPALQQQPQVEGGDPWPRAPQLLFPQPFTCSVTGCTAQRLLEEEAAGKAVCVAGQLWGGSVGLSSRHSSAVHALRSRASNGKRLLSVTVNQIGEIRGLFA